MEFDILRDARSDSMNWSIVPLLLMLASSGDLWIHVQSGVAIWIDGRPVGESTQEEAGKMVQGLTPGPHDVTFKTTAGGETHMLVDIVDGQTREVSISALALARRSSSTPTTGVVSVALGTSTCAVLLDGRKADESTGDARIDSVDPGRHDLSVQCAGRKAEGLVDVAAGAVTNVVPDFRTHRLTSTKEARKPMALTVVSTNETIIRNSTLPEEWKQALVAISVPGCSVQRLSAMMSLPGVAVAYRCGGTGPGRLIEAIQAQPLVVKAALDGVKYLKTGELDLSVVVQLRYKQ